MDVTDRMDADDTEDLVALAAEIAACRVCRDTPARGPADRLPHEPRPVVQVAQTARICIASQAPGVRVHESGRPFNDRSGIRLRQWLGIEDCEFYDASRVAIVPMGFCFPGNKSDGSDLPPRRECAEIWREQLFAIMAKNAGRATAFFRLPPERVVELGVQVEI